MSADRLFSSPSPRVFTLPPAAPFLTELARGLTERAASLDDDAYAAALASAKLLIGGALFAVAEEKSGRTR